MKNFRHANVKLQATRVVVVGGCFGFELVSLVVATSICALGKISSICYTLNTTMILHMLLVNSHQADKITLLMTAKTITTATQARCQHFVELIRYLCSCKYVTTLKIRLYGMLEELHFK